GGSAALAGRNLAQQTAAAQPRSRDQPGHDHQGDPIGQPHVDAVPSHGQKVLPAVKGRPCLPAYSPAPDPTGFDARAAGSPPGWPESAPPRRTDRTPAGRPTAASASTGAWWTPG